MKKIFLTSGIVVCMACPAFATGFTAQQGTDGSVANACNIDYLGVNSGSATLRAIWNLDATRMRLSSNKFDTNNALNTGGASTNDPFFQYEPSLYVSTVEGKIYTLNDTTNEYEEVANNTVILTDFPAGAEVAFVPHLNLPSGYTNVENATVEVTSTPRERTFRGFFTTVDANGTSITVTDSTPSSEACISKQGVLKIPANSDCLGSLAYYDPNNNGSSNVWKAMYRRVHPSLDTKINNVTKTAPSMYGYTFNGWALSESDANEVKNIQNGQNGQGDIYNSNDSTGYVIAQDTDIWGSWTPNSYTVTYSCNGGTGSVANAAATFDAPFTWAGNDDTANGTGCKKTGYHFTGWTCKVAAADTTNTTEKTIISNGGVTCTGADANNPRACTGAEVNKWTETNLINGATVACEAQWANNVISISWNKNGATTPVGEIADGSCTYGEGVTLPANPTRAGYTFGGWEVVSNNP